MRNLLRTCILTLIVFFTAPTSLLAADIISDTNVIVTERTENLYTTGNSILISAPVERDLVAAGRDIFVQESIERNILAAGALVEINSPFVGGSVRVAGGTITLSGTFNEDVVLTGGEVLIENATINGDLLIAAGTVDIQNSTIAGDFLGTYNKRKGDIASQVMGSIKVHEVETDNEKESTFLSKIHLPWEFSIIVTLIIVSLLLSARNRLDIPSLKLNKQFLIDILIGLGVVIIPAVAALISFFVFLFPLIVPLSLIIYLAIPLVFMILPLYVANTIKHSFYLDLDIRLLVAIIYVTFFLFFNIPGLDIFTVIPMIFFFGALGFLTRMDLRAMHHYLEPRSKDKTGKNNKKRS
ncbi:MAG: hypothetical protein ACOCXQ_04595 [Patescibacteria group bacterium]